MQSLLKTMPLWRLQWVGHEDIRFLYEPGPGASHITLLPGVACHLRELQRGRCFYCERSLPATAAVDHFIPWSQWPSGAMGTPSA